jgi:hypothetical protein
MSFFGGRIGASVDFPGPNREAWNMADIVMPLRSGEYSFTTSKLLQPLPVRIETSDLRKIIPSIDPINVEVVSVVKTIQR